MKPSLLMLGNMSFSFTASSFSLLLMPRLPPKKESNFLYCLSSKLRTIPVLQASSIFINENDGVFNVTSSIANMSNMLFFNH